MFKLEFNNSYFEQSKSVCHDIINLHRSITGKGIDDAFTHLKNFIDCNIHEYKSGTKCLDWIIPSSWEFNTLKVVNITTGKDFITFDHPLRVASHSKSFHGIISGSNLKKRCSFAGQVINALPHQYLYYNDDWRLSVTQDEYRSIVESDDYLVDLNTTLYDSTLKIAESNSKDSNSPTFAFLSHLCHPAQFNDGLVGVLTNIYLHKLITDQKTRYNYKFLFMPETIGSIAYCSNTSNLSNILSCIFTEMTALSSTLHLQRSNDDNDFINNYAILASKCLQLNMKSSPFLGVIRNDEKVFNSPGIEIPSISITRALGRQFKNHPFKNYHTSFDTMENANFNKLIEALLLLQKIIEIIENDYVIERKFSGIPMLSRHGLFYSPKENRSMYNLTEKIAMSLDKPLKISDIAIKLDENFETVYSVLSSWKSKDLVTFI